MKRLVVLMVALGLGIAACGKRGDPKPPEGATITYPKQYPAPKQD